MQYRHPIQKAGIACLVLSLFITASVILAPVHTISAAQTPTLVQQKDIEISSGKTANVTFTTTNTAGNTIVVYTLWNSLGTASVTDSRGNVYVSAVGPTKYSGDAATAQIFYAKNIASGANTITVTYTNTITQYGIVYAHEYSGIDTTNPVDVTAFGTGSSAAISTASVTTTNPTDMLFVGTESKGAVTQVGAGYTLRSNAHGNMTEDRNVTTAGSYAGTATQNSNGWVAQLVAFRAAASGPADTIAPSVPTNLAVVNTTQAQVSLSWTASTDNVGVTGYKIFRNGSQVGTSTVTNFSDQGLAANTTYSYTVAAFDAAGNTSSQSGSVNATTQPFVPDTTAPSIPTSLSANAVAQNQINLSWNASTDNVGVTGYTVFRNNVQVATTTINSLNDTGLAQNTTYSYTVSAYDAAGNNSGVSAPASATTPAGPVYPIYPLKASVDGRSLVDQNNVPTFIVGDSPHALIANVSLADAATYFANRASYGVNALWAELTCGSYIPGCRGNMSTYDGIVPFNGSDVTSPNPAYFARVDAMVQLAAQYGIQIVLDPLETGAEMSLVINAGNTGAFNYGVYLGNRYKNSPNVIWLTGNDFQSWITDRDNQLIKNIMAGIASVDPNHLQTEQLNYVVSGTHDDALLVPYTTLGQVYSYPPQYARIYTEYNATPKLPVFMEEANYEGEDNQHNDPSTNKILRQQEYWSMLAGALGGQMWGSGVTAYMQAGWQGNLNTPGVAQLKIMKNFFLSKQWQSLVPDQNHTVVTAGFGTFASSGAVHTNTYVTTARATDGSLILAYTPAATTLTVDMTKLFGSITARWFDPSNGTYRAISGSPFANTGTRQFTTPGSNSDNDPDWVLVLEAPITPDTVPPTAPANLTATALSSSQVNLAWSAATDDRGVVSYNVYRNGLQVASTSLLSYSDTGLASGSTYSYSVAAVDAAGNVSSQSNVAMATTPTPDTTAPSVPTNLSGSAISSAQVNLTWTASVDNVGVTGYNIYRGGTLIGSSVTNFYTDNTVAPSTTYIYTVAAYDASNNLSPQSQPFSVTTPVQTVSPIAFVQATGFNNTAGATTLVQAFASNNTAGNTIVVAGSWDSSGSAATVTVTDSQGNTYAQATLDNDIVNQQALTIWYASNIKAGANTVTVHLGTSHSWRRLAISEYSGLAATNPVDVTAKNIALGSIATDNVTSNSATPISSGDLIFGAVTDDDGVTVTTAGTGFTKRTAVGGDTLAVEDKVQTAATSVAAKWTFGATHRYLSQMVAFKPVP